MGGMSIFSGLVQGLGGSLGSMYSKQRDQEDQKQQWMLHLLSSSLINDDTLPQGARREGLRQIGGQYGIKMPDDLLNMVAPDYPDEGGSEQQMQPMPQSPIQKAMPQDGKAAGQASAPPPSPSGQATPTSESQPMGAGMMGEMPRNPLMDGPTVLPSVGSKSAPVTASYTQGPGTTADHVELATHIQQLEQQLDQMPQRGIGKSGNLSRSDMLANRARRMQQEDQQRQLVLQQLQSLQSMQNQRDQAAWADGPGMHQKVAGIEQELGRPLTPQEKAQYLGVQPNAQEMERNNEAEDYRIVGDGSISPADPNKKAALSRVREKELRNAQLLASTQNMLSEITKRAAEDKDPVNKPGYVTRTKALSAAAAGGLFGMREQQEYSEQRTQYWMQELQSGASSVPVAPTGDPEKDKMNAFIANLAAISKSNPQTLRANAVKLAQQDVKGYQAKLADQIFNNTVAFPDKKTVTLQWLRHRAQQAADMGGDANKLWSYWKDRAIILDDDLEPWQNPK